MWDSIFSDDERINLTILNIKVYKEKIVEKCGCEEKVHLIDKNDIQLDLMSKTDVAWAIADVNIVEAMPTWCSVEFTGKTKFSGIVVYASGKLDNNEMKTAVKFINAISSTVGQEDKTTAQIKFKQSDSEDLTIRGVLGYITLNLITNEWKCNKLTLDNCELLSVKVETKPNYNTVLLEQDKEEKMKTIEMYNCKNKYTDIRSNS